MTAVVDRSRWPTEHGSRAAAEKEKVEGEECELGTKMK
jgi:hypothetical protein